MKKENESKNYKHTYTQIKKKYSVVNNLLWTNEHICKDHELLLLRIVFQQSDGFHPPFVKLSKIVQAELFLDGSDIVI